MNLDNRINRADAPFQSEPFSPRFPWIGADLQTIRNVLIIDVLGRAPFLATPTQLRLPLRDGSGDTLVAAYNKAMAGPKGVVVVAHGLTGCSESAHMLIIAKVLLDAGYAVVRLNLRGAGASAKHCGDTYHAGRSEDVRDAISGVIKNLPDVSGLPIFMVGVSLGGNVLIKFLAEFGGTFGIQAAATVCAPVDLAKTSRWFCRFRNAIYQNWLLNRMKQDTRRLPLTSEMRNRIDRTRSVFEFDDCFIAPRFGYADADDYYAHCSAARFLNAVETPTLLIHAQDDPWVPASTYKEIDWKTNPFLTPSVQRRGGHVGFHGHQSKNPWYAEEISRYFSSILDR